MFDAIVVGARCAGSSTAMLLGRKGLNVLVVDQAHFPSDTLSTHQVQVPGVACLARWGLLDRIVAAGTPATRHVRFAPGPFVLEGTYPAFEGVDALFSPRRTLLDAILVDAARDAGAEVREDSIVEGLLFDGDHVVGVRGRTKGGGPFEERARLVIGADGKRSSVAKALGAPVVKEVPASTAAFYTYWEGVEVRRGEISSGPGYGVGAWPTNEGLVLLFVSVPLGEFERFRADTERNFLAAVDGAGDLGERVRAGRRAERIRGTIDVPNVVRVPFGPGWALVGDAGLVMDPITGQGIGNAFRDAEALSEAVAAGLGGETLMEDALAGCQRRRDAAVLPMWEFTRDLARMQPLPIEARVLFGSLEGRQAEIDRFLGVLTGSEPLAEYMAGSNMRRIVGVKGLARIVAGKIRGGRTSRAAARGASPRYAGPERNTIHVQTSAAGGPGHVLEAQ
jgi:2-polyprenyl-6-methoxyphenol hydroxylase-like FAD-dependent oxidoreductase